MATKFQLAIQGGGARLADLLAAVEVVQQFETDKKIKITRVAGTSAGAIAAAILACRKVREARTYLDKNAEGITGRILPNGVPTGWSLLWTVLTGGSVCDPNVLRKEMTALFTALLDAKSTMNFSSLTSNQMLSDLDLASRELIVVAANIATRDKQVYSGPNENLVDALLNSCAIPILFRAPKDLPANPYVDGCFCENLPSEELSKDFETYGSVIAISFPNRLDGSTPNSTLGLAAQLLATGMNHSVQRAIRQLPTHALLSIDSELNPLDFANGFDLKKRKRDFELIELKAVKWLETNAEPKDGGTLPVPIFPGNDGVEAIMGDLYEWYVKSQAAVPKRSLVHSLTVTAHSLRDRAPGELERSDEIEKWYHFSPKDVPMNCFYMEIGSSERGVIFTRPQMIDVVDPDGKPVQVRILPTIDRSAKPTSPDVIYRGYLVLFEPSLPPMSAEDIRNERCYKLRYVTEVPGAMHPLVTEKKDFILVENTNIDLIETVNIVFVSPPEVAYDAIATVRNQGNGRDPSEMKPDELLFFRQRRPPNFVVRGWTTSGFGKNFEMRVDLTKRR